MSVGRKRRLCVSAALGVVLTLPGGVALAQPAGDEAFLALAQAYADRDPQAAARAYSEDAEVIYAYDGAPEERYRGRAAIEQSFAGFFGQIDPADGLDLNFRMIERQGDMAHGVYRLRLGPASTSFGRFEVIQGPDGLFLSDRSTSAGLADFEEAAGPVLVAPEDETLDPDYYRLLTGRYRLPTGCALVVTRSVVRLFVRNTCDQSWRGLQRVSGLDWTGGPTVLSDRAETTFSFDRVADAPSAYLVIQSGSEITQAVRDTPYNLEAVEFPSADGTLLTGTLYVPVRASAPAPATVLVHGSGPQDRDGYASIIAVLADALAAEGRVVLAYDKRGSGGSGGDGDSAGFDVLAADAQAAMTYLRGRAEVEPTQVGLAGSSQAGWIIATAIRDGAEPADVFLLGAAGAAFSVREQNLYNTEVLMRCAGIAEPSRRLVLAQQAAFFDAVQDLSQAARLDSLTREAVTHPEIRDWLFPDSTGLDTPGAWFTVLDPAFDPLPVWRGYDGHAVLAFGAHDDATDTAGAITRLQDAGLASVLLPDSQHLGLDATDVCDADLGGRTRFSPELFEAISAFARDRR